MPELKRFFCFDVFPYPILSNFFVAWALPYIEQFFVAWALPYIEQGQGKSECWPSLQEYKLQSDCNPKSYHYQVGITITKTTTTTTTTITTRTTRKQQQENNNNKTTKIKQQQQ